MLRAPPSTPQPHPNPIFMENQVINHVLYAEKYGNQEAAEKWNSVGKIGSCCQSIDGTSNTCHKVRVCNFQGQNSPKNISSTSKVKYKLDI